MPITESAKELLIECCRMTGEPEAKFTLGELSGWLEGCGKTRSMIGMKRTTLPALIRRGFIEEVPMGYKVTDRGYHIAFHWVGGKGML